MMKVMIVNELMTGDVSPVAMFCIGEPPISRKWFDRRDDMDRRD